MQFKTLLSRFTAAVVAGDGRALGACFSPGGCYHDYIYGRFEGRAAIGRMLEELWHRDATDYRWDMFDAVSDGRVGYANWLFSYTVTAAEFAGRRPLVSGVSRFRLEDGLIAAYDEWVNAGLTMAQIGLAPERMARLFRRQADELRARPQARAYLET